VPRFSFSCHSFALYVRLVTKHHYALNVGAKATNDDD
jgi:hypothetical protein